jgi:hypothetical protein
MVDSCEQNSAMNNTLGSELLSLPPEIREKVYEYAIDVRSWYFDVEDEQYESYLRFAEGIGDLAGFTSDFQGNYLFCYSIGKFAPKPCQPSFEDCRLSL